MKRIFVLLLLVFCLWGCERPYSVSEQLKEDISKKLVYFKDSKGICYAVISNGNSYGNVISFTSISCEQAGL